MQQSKSESPERDDRPVKFSNIPGLVLDELTEYAMAKEGIELKDLEPK